MDRPAPQIDANWTARARGRAAGEEIGAWAQARLFDPLGIPAVDGERVVTPLLGG